MNHPIAPIGRLVDMLILPLQGGAVYIRGSSTQVTFQGCQIYQNTASSSVRACVELVKSPMAPLGYLLTCLPRLKLILTLQGGAANIFHGTVTFENCNMYENTADWVCARL